MAKEIVVESYDNSIIDEEEYLNKMIKECSWRKDLGGTPICKGECGPCERIIELGRCGTLIDYFATKRKDYVVTQEDREEE